MLIDVTLVEVSRTDSFEYDLNLVAGAKDAVVGNLVIDSIQKTDTTSRLEAGFNLMDQDGNPTGKTQAFYSDEKVQALLTAIQRKNYGRVLAKPKIMVDDGQEGRIVTTDETTYVKESIQIPQTGTPITTRDFVPIEASIELQITPHISEGELLRLTVHMSRDDWKGLWSRESLYERPQSFVEVVHPDDREVLIDGMRGHAEGTWDFEYRIVRPDGSVCWVRDRGFPIHDEQRNLRMMCGVATDISAHKQAEERMLADRAALRSLTSELQLAEERQRRRLARDLHDSIGQSTQMPRKWKYCLKRPETNYILPSKMTETVSTYRFSTANRDNCISVPRL